VSGRRGRRWRLYLTTGWGLDRPSLEDVRLPMPVDGRFAYAELISNMPQGATRSQGFVDGPTLGVSANSA